MKAKENLSIAFTGLKNGVHSFTFSVDNSFFEQRDYSVIKAGKLDLEVQLDKKDAFLVLDIAYAGLVEQECDRCASKLLFPIHGTASLVVNIGEAEGNNNNDDEVIYLSHNANEVDFSQYFYENVVVNIPLYKICEDDASGEKECNEKVLSYLEGDDENEENKETDPRWEKLKILKENDNGAS